MLLIDKYVCQHCECGECRCEDCRTNTYYLTTPTARASRALARALRRRGAKVTYRGEHLVTRATRRSLKAAQLSVGVLPTTWLITNEPLVTAGKAWL